MAAPLRQATTNKVLIACKPGSRKFLTNFNSCSLAKAIKLPEAEVPYESLKEMDDVVRPHHNRQSHPT